MLVVVFSISLVYSDRCHVYLILLPFICNLFKQNHTTMKELKEENGGTNEIDTVDIENAPSDSSKLTHICSNVHYLLRSFAIAACLAGCVYFLMTSTGRLYEKSIVQEYSATESVDSASLQFTVCPVAPFEQMASLEFGHHMKIANHLRIPKMSMIENPEFVDALVQSISCLYSSQYAQKDDSFQSKMRALDSHPHCIKHTTWKKKGVFSNNFTEDAQEIFQWFQSYGAMYMLNLYNEGAVDYYEGIYENIDILKQDNTTLPEYLKGAARDFREYITSDFDEIDNVNLNTPTQKVVVKSLSTRFGPMCRSYTLMPRQHRRLYQRYELKLTFKRIQLAYLLVFVNENRTFSDVPGAAIMLPYRIPLDTNSILHVRRIEKTTKHETEDCKAYDPSSSPESRVECMEKCLLAKVVKHGNLTCLMPWMDKNSTLGLPAKPFCYTSKDFLETRHTAAQVLGGDSSDCIDKCREDCQKLNILVKIMGIVRPSSHKDNQYHSIIIIVSNEMDIFHNRLSYGKIDFICEVFGSLSFILGIALVAGVDWLFATLLWFFGKLPYIPAMPPLINTDIYLRDIYYNIRHELCGVPIPITVSQVYLRAHEQRRYAVELKTTTTTSDGHKGEERHMTDARSARPSAHARFPRMNLRKSSLTIMSQTLAAVTRNQSDSTFLQQQFETKPETFSGSEDNVKAHGSMHKRSSYPMTSLSLQGKLQPHMSNKLSVSFHGMPTRWKGPKITIDRPAEESGQIHAPGASLLPDIEHERRPSQAHSMLHQLETAEMAAPSPPTTRGQRRASAYRRRPRRISHAVAPVVPPVPEEPD